MSYSIVKPERKTDFIIQKRAKKTQDPNSNSNATVSPIKIIKVIDKYHDLKNSAFSSTLSSLHSNTSPNINYLLQSKQLEPVEIHSFMSKDENSTKRNELIHKPSIQSTNRKTLVNTSPSSSNTNVSLNNSDHTRFVYFSIVFK